MPFAWPSKWPATLRIRLTLWNTAAVLLLLVVGLLAIRAGVEMVLTSILDEFLQEEMDTSADAVARLAESRERLVERLERKATSHPRRKLFIQLLTSDGAPEWSSSHTPEIAFPSHVLQVTSDPIPWDSYRLLHRSVVLPDGKRGLLRVGCATRQLELELARLTEILLLAAGVLLLLSPLGGYLLAGRTTRLLAQINRTAAQLHPARLQERLPIRHTGDELDQLSATINSLLDRIAASIKQSRELTANAAHELRSPLTAIQSTLEVALNADRSPAEYRDVLSTLLEESDHLRVLVNQLLVLAESDIGKLCLLREPVRLDHVVRKSFQMFQPAAEASGVHLRLGRLDAVLLSADSTRLWQVVNNLLDNAVKFTPAGGSITLDLALEPATGAGVLRVSDSGIGIAPEDLPHVFERFYQGDKARQRRRERGGTGLGLSICQAILEAHGGRITAASKPGQGTTFTVTLPGCSPAPAE
jgi:heavy metal sensor kinase